MNKAASSQAAKPMENTQLKQIIEAALMVAGQPLNLGQLAALFPADEQPDKNELRAVLEELAAECEDRGVEVSEVASGYRFQVKQDIYPHIARMWEEKPQRYSRALLETLALIAYRQPITRGEIEEVRGVSVSSNIIRTLEERDWIRVVGHRDVPGKPALFGTTRGFLDYFNLKSLDELPSLAELKDIDDLEPELDFGDKAAASRSDQGETAQDQVDQDPANQDGDAQDGAQSAAHSGEMNNDNHPESSASDDAGSEHTQPASASADGEPDSPSPAPTDDDPANKEATPATDAHNTANADNDPLLEDPFDDRLDEAFAGTPAAGDDAADTTPADQPAEDDSHLAEDLDAMLAEVDTVLESNQPQPLETATAASHAASVYSELDTADETRSATDGDDANDNAASVATESQDGQADDGRTDDGQADDDRTDDDQADDGPGTDAGQSDGDQNNGERARPEQADPHTENAGEADTPRYD